jgi:hypothetical protein
LIDAAGHLICKSLKNKDCVFGPACAKGFMELGCQVSFGEGAMRVRLTDTVNKPSESEQTYHGSIEGFVRRPKQSWEAVFARFEHATGQTTDSEGSEAESEHEDAQTVR